MEREVGEDEIAFDLNRLLDREKKLAKYTGPDRVLMNAELYEELEKQLSEHQPVELKSKIPTLDHHIHAFYGGELSVISGPTGNGKTLFAQTLTSAFCRQDKKILWFTYEVGAYDFLKNGFGGIEQMPFFLMPRELKESSLVWVEDRIMEAKLKHGVDAVFIDHLHYLIDLKKNFNASLEIGRVMRFLKLLAVNENIHIFLLAHIRKVNTEDEPDNDSLRDSSLVAQESDNIIFIWRMKNTENESKLKISKNRRFGVFNKYANMKKIGRYLRETFDNGREVPTDDEIDGRDYSAGRKDIYD